MKKQLQRLLFTALIVLLGGENSAWAAEGDVTTNADIDFSNSITGLYSIAGNVGSMTWTQQWTYTPTIVDGILRFGNFNGGVVELQNNNIRSKDKVTITFEMAFGKLNGKHVGFKLVDAEGTDLLTQWFDAYNGDFDDANPLNLSWDYMYRGSNTVLQDRCVYFTIVFDYASKKVTTTTKCYLSGTNKAATDGSFEADWTTTAPIAKFVLQGNIDNADRYSTIDNLKITTTEGNYTAATANYTVKYICGEETVKEDAVYTGDVNADITLAASDKANFFNSDESVRYIYVSDDAEGKTVAEDGSTVVTVTFREAEKYNYSIGSAYNGTALAFSKEGSVWEDLNNITVSYPRYQVSGTTLVGLAPVSNNLQKSYTISENNFNQTLEYTSEGIDNICLLSEAENLGTSLPTNPTAFGARVSNELIIYGAKADLLTLPAGKYIFTLGAIGGDNSSHKVNYVVYKEATPTEGDHDEANKIAEGTCTGNFLTLITSDEFTLTEETTISFTSSDPSSQRGIDLIYVQKTGDYDPSIVQNDYLVDFNSSITTSNHNFAVASKWGHIVPNSDYDGYGPYYMSYSYNATAGVDGTGALGANRQYAGDYSGGEVVYDLLVTPVVSGTITLQVKAMTTASNSNNAFVEFYSLNEDGTAKDELLLTVKENIPGYNSGSNTDWYTATLEVSEAQKIGIRAQYVYLDNFTATSMKYIPAAGLTVMSVMNMEGKGGTNGTTTYFEQQSDGTLSVPLKVYLSNTGDVDLVAGTTENYTLTLASASYASGTKTYYEDATVDVPVSLAAGASDTVAVTFNVPYPSNSWNYWFVRENITSTTSSTSRYAGLIAYEPKFIFRVAESTSTSSLSGAQAYGLIGEETTNHYEIANTGTAPLVIKSITLPEGFTSANLPEIPEEGLSIAKGTTQALDITLPITTMGSFSGNLTIVYLDKNDAEQTYTLAFSGNVLAAGTWAADFNGGDAIAYPAGSIAEGGINSGSQYSDGAYNYYIMGRTTSSYASENNKFITPKLHAAAGDALTFDVKGAYGSSYYAKVYVSTDRVNWGEPVATYTYAETEGAEAIGSSDWVNKSVSFAEEGDYYVAFSLYGEFKIDNIIGLTKVDVAHDIYVKKVEWPDASVKSGSALSKPSVDIIPLTDEDAENYTVKYIYGENEVAIESKALTASVNSTTNFAASFTPEVESTTTFPGTKVVFEFTDGTKFETETFDLTVTNEPIFHFLNSKYSSRWYEPSSDYTTPVNFGKTNEAGASKTFYVLNWGSAALNVKSITVPEGFTASASSMNIPAFDGTQDGLETCQQALDITFSATEAGTYSGNLVITYVNGAGEDATFELAISGTMLDPTKWYANFGSSSNQWPAGSVYQSSVSTTYVNTGDYAITSSSSTNNIFVTPKLTATAGDKLLFDAKLYNSTWSEGKVVVYAAATRDEVLNAEEGTTRTQLFSVSGQDETDPMTVDFQTFEVPALAGDYYYGFEISNRPYVDEIYGLTQTAVAHDLTIASSNIPTEGMQNITTTATVNVLNLGVADDEATVTAYVDGEAVATSEAVAIPMAHQLSATGTQLSVSFHSPKAGTFPVYLEVKAGDYTLTTDPVDVEFAEEEGKSDADMATNGTTYEVPLYLNYKNSESVTMYNAEALAATGLTAGTKIKKITYKGYKTTDVQTTSFQVYYKWTDDQTLSQPATTYPYAAADNGMTKLIDEDHTWNKVGSSSEMGDMIVLDFSDSPITYESGKSLVVYMHSYVDGYKTAYFEKSTLSSDFCYTRKADAATLSSSFSKAVPAAIHFTLEATSTTIAGTVTGASGAATVTLVSTDGDNVQYAGTVNDGAYSVNVIQTGRTYDVTVADAAANTVVAKNVSFDGNVTKNFNFGTLTLDGNATEAPADAVYAKVNMGRNLNKGWNAVVLPFAVAADEVATKFGANTEIAAYTGDEQGADEKVTVNFAKTTAIEANVPYLVYVAATVTAPEFENADVAAAEAKVEGTVFDFVGLYAKTTVNAGDYFVKGGQLVKATANNSVLAYRSYLKLHEGQEARSIRMTLDGEDMEGETTGIKVVNSADEAADGIYNLSGQKLQKAHKGLNIINGKKVVIK